MSFEVIDAKKDSAVWGKVLSKMPLPQQDIYFTSEYVAMHCFDPDAEALAFLYNERSDVWFYPFIKQPIPLTKEGALTGSSWHDITSPYG